MLSVFLSGADIISLGSWCKVFNVLTLKAAKLKVILLLRKFGLVWYLIFRTLGPELMPQQNAPLVDQREKHWVL